MVKANRKTNIEGAPGFSQHKTVVLISLFKTFTKTWKKELKHLEELTNVTTAIKVELKERGVEV